jgi:phage-related protein
MSIPDTRPVLWLSSARKDFAKFPAVVRDDALDALSALADGSMPKMAKPLKNMGNGVAELVLRHKGDAFRVIYVLHIGPAVWVIHAFQKKSKTGIKTPKIEIDLIHERLKRLKETLE